MKTLLNILNKLDIAELVISELLKTEVQVSIEPTSDDCFYVNLKLCDENSEYYNDNLIGLVIHTEDESNLTYHVYQRHVLAYDYDAIGRALAGSISVYEEYKYKGGS
jgi:hypothetical protein